MHMGQGKHHSDGYSLDENKADIIEVLIGALSDPGTGFSSTKFMLK